MKHKLTTELTDEEIEPWLLVDGKFADAHKIANKQDDKTKREILDWLDRHNVAPFTIDANGMLIVLRDDWKRFRQEVEGGK